ncbi:type I restriction-modification system subunit M [Flagellimonas olearia]|uniref:site-specific DNA-methyltransferase (adenine-specific) n=1 Tax=Flagellimonas olearia TaxID=552546 RepID=A0A444VM52_9FLAO|nr:type I restriction-modification system subunit M [Allomuricauda olearia]RYC51861.1 type I restriction-modification protein subunit M [Allomuricauda olearia]
MSNKLTQSEINEKVWAACDTFRGTIDATQYKDYILTMLFIKYITDVSNEKREDYLKKYDGDVERVERAMKHERFKIPKESSFDFLYENRNEPNLGELINIALENIEDANRGKLEKVFRNIDYNSEPNLGQTKDRNRRLKNLLGDFVGLNLRPSNLEGNDIIGDAYEYLIEKFASDAGKKAGEFYTPKNVSILLAKLVEAKAGDRISDPTCGSGSLLLKVANEIGSKNVSLNGQEVNGSTWALARMNMFLHEMDNARIEWGDTLNNPLLREGDALMKFDVVVANPPFSLDKWGAENASSDKYNRFHRGTPPKSKGDYAFITHMIETLNEHGKAGVVLPHGVLFRGSSEGKIRKQLIDENLLKAVIGLPANLFYGTGIPATILIFDKNKGDNSDVLFIDASNEYDSGKNQNILNEKNIEKIIATYKNWETIDKYSHVATREELLENDYNLNIPRYVDTFVEEEPVDIKATQMEILSLKQQIADVEKKLEAHLTELGL